MAQQNVANSFGDITQVEVDFGSVGVYSASFTVTDSRVNTSSLIIAQQSYDAPTGKDQDENEMDTLNCMCSAGAGQFTLYVTANLDCVVADNFKINYSIG